MAVDPSTPVIVGVGQYVHRSAVEPGPEPLTSWELACRLAAEDAALPFSALQTTDFLACALSLSWAYDDPVARLAGRIGATPREQYMSQPSGTAGHVMLHRAAAAIRAGAKFAVICGGESLATAKLYRRNGERPNWSYPASPGTIIDLDKRRLPVEAAAGLTQGLGAVYGFAMRDIARRAHLGVEPRAYRQRIGDLMAGMTRVAAANPDAWFPVEREAEYLIGPRADNRMVAYPYTKNMTAIMDVDISAALILTSEAMADRMSVPRDRRVYPWLGCFAQDPVYTAVRPDLWKSSAMEAAASAVLTQADMTADQIGHIDLYSCFPSAINFACDVLGISDPSGECITVTGGLPYAGGPASSYMLTSLVKMTQRLRADRGAFGLASGVGKQMAHHAFGLYSTRPPSPRLRAIDERTVQGEVDRIAQIPVVDGYRGPATIATYTVIHHRLGAATHGAAICDLPNGARSYALMTDPDILSEAEATELVGRQFDIVDSDRLEIGRLKRRNAPFMSLRPK
ncbi:acetyl-coenzyme A synthetase [Sphingobium chlorophenolicum L-1]|uniref:Acetyl-coenzyme A synthetase n=1 Tax=Sphingobium chlorophenolicum L-1 TaxID=690566 RepID=F6F346_SPHCR|nr:acetyl-coenzyme A synthetase [Sphingobium chlorophenolicum]AEG50858.1 acetyl-coenzyme A synthetase [Sphingobium chlorophenolicum L-1]